MKRTIQTPSGLAPRDIVILGLPFDANASYLRGPALAPARIREALFCPSANLCTENRVDLGACSGWHLLPDLDLPDPREALAQIRGEISGLLEKNLRVISLGGDHSVTLPAVQAHAAHYPELNLLHFDAHPDLYDALDGNRYSHASPFARIMEAGRVRRLVQVGIRTMTVHQQEQAERFGVEVIEMRELGPAGALAFDGPVYVSIDLDCLDPACAPGVSHHEPGGLSTRELLSLIQNFKGEMVGADIVEYNPRRDINGMTGMVAAKLLKEVMARLMETR